MTGCDELGRNHLAGKSTSPTRAFAQVTLSAVKSVLHEMIDCFRSLLNETVLQSFDVFYDSRKYLFCLLTCYFMFLSAACVSSCNQTDASGMCKFLQPNRRFTLKMVSIVRESDVRVDLIRNVDNPLCKFSQRDF